MLLSIVDCNNCGRSYPEDGTPYRCPVCSGVYNFAAPPVYRQHLVDKAQPGIWRYRHTFGFPEDVGAISLNEGDTPLIWAEAYGRKVAFKCEFLNPTGSFKDRGSATLVSWLCSRGATEAVEDSSGNAGASFAAYAVKAGIRARVFVPEAISVPKRKQIEAYGAELVIIKGSRSDVSESVKREADLGSTYASHAYLPFNIPGYASASYEVYEQLGRMPGTVIVPVGQGGMLLGLWYGFTAIRRADMTIEMPRLIGVQARACAPLWALFTAESGGLGFVAEASTLAEGVRVRYPLRGAVVLQAIAESRGSICAVDEEKILLGQAELARRGLYVEPTSAIVWDGLAQIIDRTPDPIVVILTGSGYKQG